MSKFSYNKIIVGILLLLLLISLFKLVFNPGKNIPKDPDSKELDLVRFEIQNSKSSAYISGAVKNPGVYTINEETLLIELVNHAGGFSDEVDREKINREINLSIKVNNQDHFYIPFRGEGEVNSNVSQVNSSEVGQLISLNNSTQEELEGLPGIGETIALRIIENRPYANIEEVQTKADVSETLFLKIKSLVVL